LEVYIVRIYRRDESDPRMVAGIVEEPGEPERKAFANTDELWNILGLKGLRSRSLGSSNKREETELPEDKKRG